MGAIGCNSMYFLGFFDDQEVLWNEPFNMHVLVKRKQNNDYRFQISYWCRVIRMCWSRAVIWIDWANGHSPIFIYSSGTAKMEQQTGHHEWLIGDGKKE